MYSIDSYGEMIADGARTDAYARAIRQAVRPGSVVLDIGTGTGLFAVLACQSGARRVYAIEASDVIEVARRIASDNGCADSIEFIHAMSTEVSLPDRADVIVSDLHGVLPLYQNHLPTIVDARRRFLAPGGVLIPRSESLWLACVEAPDLHRRITTPWADNKYGLDLRAGRDLQANQWHRAIVEPRQMITRPEYCGTIDYSIAEDPDFVANVALSAERAGFAHGFCVWFDATLADGIQFSNSPEKPSLIYGTAFFPWPEPVAIVGGDSVTVNLRANLIGDDYLWSWETRIRRPNDSVESATHFKQSDFFGEPLSVARLLKRSAGHVPALNDEGRIDRLVLKLMDEGVPLGNISRELLSRFPDRFARWQDALTRVGKLSAQYSR